MIYVYYCWIIYQIVPTVHHTGIAIYNIFFYCFTISIVLVTEQMASRM